MGQLKTEERPSAERRRPSVVTSLMRLIFSFSPSFLAGSECWNCCQIAGARLHPQRQLRAGTSRGQRLHHEEPSPETANNEKAADAGRVPNASVGCCAVLLTGKDRNNWNEEMISQQTLRVTLELLG